MVWASINCFMHFTLWASSFILLPRLFSFFLCLSGRERRAGCVDERRHQTHADAVSRGETVRARDSPCFCLQGKRVLQTAVNGGSRSAARKREKWESSAGGRDRRKDDILALSFCGSLSSSLAVCKRMFGPFRQAANIHPAL